MMDDLHYTDFVAHLNGRFNLTAGNGAAFELELLEVTENSPSPRQEQFALVFRAPLTAPSEQGIYQLTHAELGSGALFLVPLRRDAAGLYYEAIFNRSIEEARG